MKIVAKYDFNGGKGAVESNYAIEYAQIEAAINAIDSSLYKTKESVVSVPDLTDGSDCALNSA